jgi:hypothetical protein
MASNQAETGKLRVFMRNSTDAPRRTVFIIAEFGAFPPKNDESELAVDSSRKRPHTLPSEIMA